VYIKINKNPKYGKNYMSAIWYKELPDQTFLPTNVTYGVVVSGLRHPYCIDIVKTLSNLRTVKLGQTIQGFLTNGNRFVERIEAMDIKSN